MDRFIVDRGGPSLLIVRAIGYRPERVALTLAVADTCTIVLWTRKG